MTKRKTGSRFKVQGSKKVLYSSHFIAGTFVPSPAGEGQGEEI